MLFCCLFCFLVVCKNMISQAFLLPNCVNEQSWCFILVTHFVKFGKVNPSPDIHPVCLISSMACGFSCPECNNLEKKDAV